MFNGIWLVACEPLLVDGRDLQPGDRFEISRTESGALLVMGRARIAAPQAPPAKEPVTPPRRRGRPRKTETKVETAETPAPAEDAAPTEDADPPTRRYRRRDLEAESS